MIPGRKERDKPSLGLLAEYRGLSSVVTKRVTNPLHDVRRT